MTPRLKKMIILLPALLIIVVYGVFWFSAFGRYRTAQTSYNSYVELGQLVGLSIEKNSDFPNLFIWELEKQTSSLQQAGQQLLPNLEEELNKQKLKLKTAFSDVQFLEEQLQLLNQEFTQLNTEIITSLDNFSIDDLPKIVSAINQGEET